MTVSWNPFFNCLNLLSITIVEANLVGAMDSNFNELNELEIDTHRVTHDKNFHKHCIIQNLGDPRTFFINNILFFLYSWLHICSSKQDLMCGQHMESNRWKETQPQLLNLLLYKRLHYPSQFAQHLSVQPP